MRRRDPPLEEEAVMPETQEVYYLTQYFFDQFHPDQAEQAWRDAPSWTSIAYPCYQWPLKVGSRDYIARQIGESLHLCACQACSARSAQLLCDERGRVA